MGNLIEKCKKCRAELPDGAKFCPRCGAKQGTEQKVKSRGNGTGSVYKRGNVWMAVRVIGYEVDAEGRVHKKTASKSGFATKKEALAYLPQLTMESRREKAAKITLRELYDKWEPTHDGTKSTMDCYRAAIKKFAPVWNLPVGEITVDDLQECMDDVPGKRTQQNMKTIIGILYKYAIPRHMAQLNMGQYLTVGGENGLGKDGLPLDVLETIRGCIGKVPYADYVVAQCYLGFRPSEFLALDVSSYDRKEKAFTGGAKTEAGRNRTVPVAAKIQPIIDRLTANKISGQVFCAEGGARMSLEMYRRRFYEVLDACGISNPATMVNGTEFRKYTPHSARHTFATLMKGVQGADKDKLALIGHTSDAMLRHYQDTDIQDLRQIVDAM